MVEEPLAALAARIRAREISPVEATEACLARIEALGPRLRAFIHVDTEGALRTARIREAEAIHIAVASKVSPELLRRVG